MPTSVATTDESFRKRLAAIDWASFETAYGPAVKVPAHLASLLSPDAKERLDATHALWCGLCHQHAYVSSAALPALPFLLEVLNQADEATVVEILDIFAGFAWCTPPDQLKNLPAWAAQLRNRLAEQLPRFQELAGHQNEDISGFCENILVAYGEACRIERHDRPSAVAEFPAK